MNLKNTVTYKTAIYYDPILYIFNMKNIMFLPTQLWCHTAKSWKPHQMCISESEMFFFKNIFLSLELGYYQMQVMASLIIFLNKNSL